MVLRVAFLDHLGNHVIAAIRDSLAPLMGISYLDV
jgi:hypothetical protein